ncbi:hypothetical protein BSUW23_03140 [Bacillus spizizenii str. W23]|uniref:Uncharacterized protein n=1 Tax=Bacillus spizizenii (strain ATCC 23059 / NRRL B-14472 / W23) TaxID=655816 RepID=E0TTK3_BACSH|nr:hypothetical protein BSUW23_03140 [Bacillus spizizenii str. W23]EFG90671.1 hypothetical protein BSU6633_18253 [Bacillus spizizenii ATCC 6633 = JCM 2499]
MKSLPKKLTCEEEGKVMSPLEKNMMNFFLKPAYKM